MQLVVFSGLVAIGYASDREDALAARATELRARLPEGYTVVIESPWVVVGDEAPDLVAARASATVRFASRALEAELFPSRPDGIWTIWMFADHDAYESGAVNLVGHGLPTTPYGYARDGQLVMNIATGSGTLIHEMVHPYVDANAPDAPPWINEGLGSLYEQCRERDGRIVGLTNWRLSGLQSAIAAGRLPSFDTLLGLDRDAFYNRDPGTNYSQSRYLMLWLQEHGMLQTFFASWRDNRAIDPTGAKTLRRLIGAEDLDAWKPAFEQWAMALTFP